MLDRIPPVIALMFYAFMPKVLPIKLLNSVLAISKGELSNIGIASNYPDIL